MNQTPYGVTTGNPYALAELAKDKSTINRVIANVNIKFNLNKLTDGLALEIRGGTDYSNAFVTRIFLLLYSKERVITASQPKAGTDVRFI